MPSADVLDAELELVDRWWRAANYLAVGQIYLLDNPLLRKPLEVEHIKPRLLGHWGTSPGLNLLYAHLNRVIRARDADVIYVFGPGHGGPAAVANAWLDGTWSELYTDADTLAMLDMASNADGRLEVFGVNTFGQIYHTWQTQPKRRRRPPHLSGPLMLLLENPARIGNAIPAVTYLLSGG